ncbi:MAG TPA: hypothetical protein PKK30_01840, partial [Nitrospira sp.]|nr:hypothetical protein [Nitrospira sp.]
DSTSFPETGTMAVLTTRSSHERRVLGIDRTRPALAPERKLSRQMRGQYGHRVCPQEATNAMLRQTPFLR